jgi:hypothetical protein
MELAGFEPALEFLQFRPNLLDCNPKDDASWGCHLFSPILYTGENFIFILFIIIYFIYRRKNLYLFYYIQEKKNIYYFILFYYYLSNRNIEHLDFVHTALLR